MHPVAPLLVSVVSSLSQMSHDWMNGPVKEQNECVEIHHFTESNSLIAALRFSLRHTTLRPDIYYYKDN